MQQKTISAAGTCTAWQRGLHRRGCHVPAGLRADAVEVHHVHAALFIEDGRDQHGPDHIILSHLTSSPTSIKKYVQLRLVLENEHQTCIEFI